MRYLEKRLEQIKEDIQFANTTQEKNDYIRNTIVLKQLIAEKKAKHLGGK